MDAKYSLRSGGLKSGSTSSTLLIFDTKMLGEPFVIGRITHTTTTVINILIWFSKQV